MKFFKTNSGHLRHTCWVAIFFLILAAITFPVIILSKQYHWEISITQLALIVITIAFYIWYPSKEMNSIK